MTDAEKKPTKAAAPTVAPVTMRAEELAKAAGMLPASFPGPKLRPVTENPTAWLYRAAKVRFRFGDDEQLTQDEFNERIDAVRSVLIR
jgi:hypothetical protein